MFSAGPETQLTQPLRTRKTFQRQGADDLPYPQMREPRPKIKFKFD